MDKKYPGVRALRAKTQKRIPHFAWEYLNSGLGRGGNKHHNRDTLNQVKLMPGYLYTDRSPVVLETEVLGQKFDAPFGVAPIGLGGLMWPRVAEILATAAKGRNIPFCMSTFATVSHQDLYKHSGANGWFQLYRPNDDEVRESVLKSAEDAGFTTLLLTVDIPGMTRRERELAVGLSVPPKFDAQNVWQMVQRPRWSMESLMNGIPTFKVVDQHIPANLDRAGASRYVTEVIKGHLSVDHLKELRDRWKGKLLIKGLLSIDDVSRAKELGYDGVVVSNHGGRQLESAPSPVDVLPELRRAFPDYTLLADGGVRCGADIAKMIALGADMVLCGRAMMYGACAAGQAGAHHVVKILYEELEMTMNQLGIKRLEQLSSRLYKPKN